MSDIRKTTATVYVGRRGRPGVRVDFDLRRLGEGGQVVPTKLLIEVEAAVREALHDAEDVWDSALGTVRLLTAGEST